MSNQDIDQLLASIDASLLNPIEAEEITQEEEEVGEGYQQDLDLDLDVDPELLNELNKIALQAEDLNQQKVQGTQGKVEEEEDSELLRELYQLNQTRETQVERLKGVTNIETKFSIGTLSEAEAYSLEKSIVTRQFELKKLALAYRKADELKTTKKLMGEAKNLNLTLELVKNKFHPGTDFKLPSLPPLPKIKPTVEETSGTKPVPMDSVQVQGDANSTQLSSRMDSLATVHSQLSLQAETSGKLARQFYQLEDKSNALRFQRYRRAFQTQLQRLESIQSDPTLPIPQTQSELIRYQIPTTSLDIPPNVLNLHVAWGKNLSHPSLGTKLADSYLSFDLNCNTSTNQPNRGYTHTVYNSADPQFDQNFQLSVDMGSRQWLRHCQRKGLRLEVFHYRGFLYRALALGQANLSLTGLILHNQVTEQIPLLHPQTRRPTGGLIKLTLRTRHPIETNQVPDSKLQWITLLERNEPLDNRGEVQFKGIDPVHSDTRGSVPKGTTFTPIGPEELNSNSLEMDPMERLLGDYFDLNQVTTRPALEFELELLQQRNPNPFHLPLPYLRLTSMEERKLALSTKLHQLDLSHQLGQLDVFQYYQLGIQEVQFDQTVLNRMEKYPKLDRAKQIRQKRLGLVQQELEVIKTHLGL